MAVSLLMSSESMSASATQFMESVKVELTVFAITIALAFMFQGLGLSMGKNVADTKAKKVCSPTLAPNKFLNAPRSPERARTPTDGGRNKMQSANSLSPATDYPGFVSKKIDLLFEKASGRKPSDAIAIYCKMRGHRDHLTLRDALKCHTTYKPIDVYTMLIQCAGRVSRPDLITSLLEDMKEAGIDRSLSFYESAMKMLASKKCYKEALAAQTYMEMDGFSPTATTLSCLINFAMEIGDTDRAIDFFNRLAAISTPSIRAYMTILRVYSRRPDWASSLAMVRDIQHREAGLDSLVLNVALATAIAAGRLDEGQALLQELSLIQIPDVVSYNTVIKGLAQEREFDEAVKLLDTMVSAGVHPNNITFNTVMDAAIRSSRVAAAWRVLARMRDAGFAPDKFTCTTLMKGIQMGATSDQLTMVLDILRNVTSQCDTTLCGFLFRSVIEATAKANDPVLTDRAVTQMREQQVMLPAHEYQLLLKVLLKQDLSIQSGVSIAKVCRRCPQDSRAISPVQARSKEYRERPKVHACSLDAYSSRM